MANPNIVNVATVYGRTIGATLSTTALSLVPGTSNYVKKINSITVANRDGSNAADATVYAVIDGSIRYLAYQITVPAKSSLVVTSKDTSFYIEETDTLYALASAASDLDIIVSYDEIA